MPDDLRSTRKHTRIVPIGEPAPSPSGGPEPGQGPESPGAVIDGGGDDGHPTLTGIQVRSEGPLHPASPDRPLLRVLVGLNAGQVFPIDRDETLIGRARDADVRIDDPAVSRKHARILRTPDGRHILEDLGSANGVLVNARRVERADLADGDRLQVGPTLVLRFSFIAADEEALARKLYEGSTRDGLTLVYNRKYAGERLSAEVAYAQRHGTSLSLLMLDIDHFKRVNDSVGHQAGDAVLRVVAAQVQRSIRTEDVLARYGGEEFVVLVRGIEHKSVCMLANRLRVGVERLSIPWESQKLRVTVSVGVASLAECEPTQTVEGLLALADQRLYRAKAAGRNCVR